MILEGDLEIDAPRDVVWDLLNDPNILQKHMPGCESLDLVGEDRYEAVITLGVAAIKGTYKARFDILDKRPPQSYTLRIEGSGKPGFVKGEGQVTLEDLGARTLLKYSGEMQVGGVIARVGQRLIGTISKKLTRQFFQDLGREAESAE